MKSQCLCEIFYVHIPWRCSCFQSHLYQVYVISMLLSLFYIEDGAGLNGCQATLSHTHNFLQCLLPQCLGNIILAPLYYKRMHIPSAGFASHCGLWGRAIIPPPLERLGDCSGTAVFIQSLCALTRVIIVLSPFVRG